MKKSKKLKNTATTRLQLTRITRTLYFLAAGYALSIVVFDAGNLVTREALNQRWLLLTLLVVVTTLVWLLAARRQENRLRTYYCIIGLSLTVLLVAGVTTYLERGMASTSTILYSLPLVITALLHNRHALIGMTTLAITTYAFAAVRYFNTYFNEGYRIQLWGSILLISVALVTCCWLLMVLTGLRHDSQ